MLLSKIFLSALIEANQSSSIISGQMFTYNTSNTAGFEVSTKRLTKLNYQIRCLFHFFVAIEGLCRILHSKSNGPMDSYMGSGRLETSLCAVLIISSVLIAERYRVRASSSKEYATYYNSVLIAESRYEEGFDYDILKKSKMANQALFLSKMMCQRAAAPVIAIACAIDPSVPFNITWCLERLILLIGGWVPLFGRCITLILNYWCWQSMTAQGHRLTTDVLIGTTSLTYCLQVAHRNLVKALKTRGMDTGKGSNCEFSTYRSVHLLVIRYNNIMRTLLFITLLTMGVVQVVCAVTFIRCKASDVPIPLLVFLMVCTLQATLIMVVAYGFAGEFHDESSRSLKCLHEHNRYGVASVVKRDYLYAEKFLNACQIQKVQFGLSNFIEKTTPLIFQIYCLDRIIDLLLLN